MQIKTILISAIMLLLLINECKLLGQTLYAKRIDIYGEDGEDSIKLRYAKDIYHPQKGEYVLRLLSIDNKTRKKDTVFKAIRSGNRENIASINLPPEPIKRCLVKIYAPGYEPKSKNYTEEQVKKKNKNFFIDPSKLLDEETGKLAKDPNPPTPPGPGPIGPIVQPPKAPQKKIAITIGIYEIDSDRLGRRRGR